MSRVYGSEQSVIDDMRRFDVVPRWLLLFGRHPVTYRQLLEADFTGHVVLHYAVEHGFLEDCSTDEEWNVYKLTQKAIDYFMEGTEDGV